jgi:hypothetical protein
MDLLLSGLLVLVAQSGGSASGPPPPACESPEHKQFDFWVGRWDVYRSDTNQLVAHSLIEKLYGGCAVRENWMPINGFGAGGSLNSYRPEEKRWRQVYTGAGNGWADYVGGMDGEAMVIVGTQVMPNGSRTPVRITYKRAEGGSVLQIGEQSGDGGKTWSLRYHFTYRPAGSASE